MVYIICRIRYNYKQEGFLELERKRKMYNVPYRVDKFKGSFPEIRQVKVPIPSEMDR